MKILLMHNTCAEYRIKWFQKIADRADTYFVFTSDFDYKNKYGFKSNKDEQLGIRAKFLSKGLLGYKELLRIKRDLKNYSFVVLPGVDTFREFLMANYIRLSCKHVGVRTGYFWEKWEAPKETQPVFRKLKNKVLCLAASTVFKNVNVVFSGGSKSREYFMSNRVSEDRIIILPDSCEVPQCNYISLRDNYNIPQEKTIILYFGRIMDQKGLDVLIKAVMELDERYFLLIAGDGDFKTYCETLAKNKSNIAFIGAVNPWKRKNYFEQCDLFVFPGTFRGGRTDVWGLTLNEAIEAGKPVISTDAVGSAYDLIEDGLNGFRIKPEDVDALKAAIIKATQLDKQIVREVDSEIIKKYNTDNMATVFIDTVSSAINNH